MTKSSLVELQEEFIVFRESCIWLQNCFNTFQELYDSDPQTEAALKKTASAFFQDLHEILQEYFFLQVRRITDPVATCGHANLTVKTINQSLQENRASTDEIEKLSKQLNSYRELTSDISNKVVAHADKATAISRKLVGAHSAIEMKSFMSAIQQYTDLVGIALGVGPLDYRTQAGPGDVVDLIKVLKRAKPLM